MYPVNKLITNTVSKIKKDHQLEKIFKGGSISLFAQGLELVLRYLFTFIIARWLAAELLGRYNLSMSLLIALVTFGKLGLDVTFLRISAQLHAQRKYRTLVQTFRMLLLIILVTGTLLTITLFFSAEFIAEKYFQKVYMSPYIKIIAISIIPNIILPFLTQGLKGLGKIKSYVLSFHLLQPVINIVLITVAIWFLENQYVINIVFLLSSWLTIGLVYLVWRYQLNKHSNGDDPDSISIDWKSIFVIAGPIFVVTITTMIIKWSGIFILGRFSPDSEIAIYNIALKISSFVLMPLMAIENVTARQYSSSYTNKDIDKIKITAQRTSKIVMYVSIPLALLFIIFSKQIMSVFGNEYTSGFFVLILLVSSQLFNTVTGSVDLILQMTDKQVMLRNIFLVSLIISLSLNIWLIPQYGITGAAIAVLGTVVVKNVISSIMIYKYYGFWVINLKRLFKL